MTDAEIAPLLLKQHPSLPDASSAPTAPKAPYHSVRQDLLDVLWLGLPIFGSMISWVGMKTTDTSILGHVSASALSASALSDLFTMCTAVFVQASVLGILCGNAVGAGNPKLAGVYLQVSYCVLAVVVVFVMIVWQFTGWFWKWMGTDPELSEMAGYYARALAWSLPAQLGFTQLAQFFQAQRILNPEVITSTLAMALNLLVGVVVVLGVGPSFSGYGFAACPWVTTGVVYFQLLFFWAVFLHWKQLHRTAWPGWDASQITWTRIRTFGNLYLPAALGTASDFWRVAVIGTLAAQQLGDTAVAVFNTGYRIMWIVLILVNALSAASSILMTRRLGQQDPHGAKQVGETGLVLCAAVLVCLGCVTVMQTQTLGRLFTNEMDFLDQFASARWPFTMTLVLMNLAVVLERIPYSMGRTAEVFWYGFVASWGGQVPAVWYCLQYWRQDLTGLYTGMSIGYAILVILYGYMCFTSDYEYFASVAQERSEMSVDKKRVLDDALLQKPIE